MYEKNSLNRNDLIIFFIFTAIIVVFSIFISMKNIGNGFFWDDFHLVRSFTMTELKMVWHSSWDPDHIETPGYRPLTTLINQLRYWLFGENLVAHRVFLMALYVIIIVAWGRILLNLGLNNFTYLCISFLILSARNSAYHFNWIADGIHLFQGVLFITSFWLIFLSLYTSRRSYAIILSILSLIIYTISLLVREDSIIILCAILFLWIFLLYSNKDKRTKSNLQHLIIYGLLGSTITLTILFIGKYFVPERAFGFHPDGMIRMLKFTIFLAGFRGGEKYYYIATLPIILVCISFILTKYENKKIDSQKYILFLLLMIIVFVSCLPGLSVNRSNLTFFSNIFYCTWLVTGCLIFLNSITPQRLKLFLSGVLAIILIPIIIESTTNNLLLQESTAYPISNMIDTPDFIWGMYSNASVPEKRRNRVITDMDELGITQENYSTKIPILICDAYKKGLYHPTTKGDIFFPKYFMFIDDGWYPIVCRK